MNKELFAIMENIEDRLKELKDEKLDKMYEKLKEVWLEKIELSEDEKIVLKIDSPDYTKTKFLIQLEGFLKYLYNTKFLLKELKEKEDITAEDLDELSIMVENDKTLTLKDYIDIKEFIKKNKNKISLVVDDERSKYYQIKPDINKTGRLIKPKDFYKQFGFYPYEKVENSTSLIYYDLSLINYSFVNIEGCFFKDTNFCYPIKNVYKRSIKNCDFQNVDLSNQDFTKCKIEGANLRGTNAKINPQLVYKKNLISTILSGLDLSTANFSNVILKKTDLSFTGANIDLNQIQKRCAIFCNFEGLDLSNMALNSSVIIFGTNFKNTGLKLDLKYVLAGEMKNLSYCDFTGCEIIGDFSNVNLNYTVLPKNNNYVIDVTSCSIEGLVSNGAKITGRFLDDSYKNCKIKDSGLHIDPQAIKDFDLSNGDYRGCFFTNNNFDGVNVEGSLFDHRIEEFINSSKARGKSYKKHF